MMQNEFKTSERQDEDREEPLRRVSSNKLSNHPFDANIDNQTFEEKKRKNKQDMKLIDKKANVIG